MTIRTRTIRFKSDAAYTGGTSFEIVEQMRQADFDPPPTVRDFVAKAAARASHYFGATLQINMNLPDEELAERFLQEAIAKGFATEELPS